jgi:3-oxoacyl-[acyl-carrier protein] reductase
MQAHYELTGQKVLVTGGGSGIGLAAATLMARQGAQVCINHLAHDARAETAITDLRKQGLNILSSPGDVGDPVSAKDMVDHAIEQMGGLTLLVNNAGTPGTTRKIEPENLDLVDETLWHTVLEVNLLGVFRCSKAAAPALKSAQGAIVNIASTAGMGQVGSSLAYGASKAGVVNLTQNLARALAPDVRVNAVAPGAVDSSWMVEWTPQQKQFSIEKSLLKRRARPEDIAEIILFLGFSAHMVTGQVIIADAGRGL